MDAREWLASVGAVVGALLAIVLISAIGTLIAGEPCTGNPMIDWAVRK